jgi:hypothetical protein
MANKNIAKDLEAIIDSGLGSVVFPYQKGNSIRIKHMVVRESRNGYLVYDAKENTQVARTFCKTSAIAIAKNLAQGRNILKEAMQYDKVIEKNYNDALFYKHAIRASKETIVRESRKVRLDIAIDRTRWAKDHLDRFIFGS